MFLAYLIWNWQLQKGGFPRDLNPWSLAPEPLITRIVARHACDAARPEFPYPYRPTGDDVVGLRTIFFMLCSEWFYSEI